MKVEAGPRFLKALKRLDKAERDAAAAALRGLQQAWGRPHRHAGAGLRKLGPRLYELRVGLRWRILIEDAGDLLWLHDILDHDGVRRWLKAR